MTICVALHRLSYRAQLIDSNGKCLRITCNAMLINMHEASKALTHQGHGHTPCQGEGHAFKAIATYIISCSLRVSIQLTVVSNS